MKKALIIVLTVVAVATAATLVTAQTNGPETIQFTPKMGTVTFDHAKHQTSVDCATCHHTQDYASCKSCHGVDPAAPKAKNAFHNLCKDCHKQMNSGPTQCKQCHIK